MKINFDDFYTELVVTKTVEDDHIEYRLKFKNEHPGCMIIKIQSVDPLEHTGKYMPYPAGDVHIKFEASEGFEYVADAGSMEGILKAIYHLPDAVTRTMLKEID